MEIRIQDMGFSESKSHVGIHGILRRSYRSSSKDSRLSEELELELLSTHACRDPDSLLLFSELRSLRETDNSPSLTT